MNDLEAVHTASRRYCIERGEHLIAEIKSLADGPACIAASTRYGVVQGILFDIERLAPSELESMSLARNWLVMIANTATWQRWTRKNKTDIEIVAEQDERRLFHVNIETLFADLTILQSVKPIAYRHVLSDAESQAVWTKLDERWLKWGAETNPYWWPMTDQERPPHAIAVNADAFDDALPPVKLQEIVRSRGIGRVFEMREYDENFEIDTELLETYYTGAEGYWSSSETDFDWLIYASHECTITVAGEWLVATIQERWPDWKINQIDWAK